MPTEIIMPKVDMDMTKGRIVAWHVAEGEWVEKSAALFDIETDKATMEVESPASGTLRNVRVGEGEESPIGEAVGWIFAEGEDASAPDAPESPGRPEPTDPPASDEEAPREPSAVRPMHEKPRANAQGANGTGAREGEKPRATPVARRIARNEGIALKEVEGSGPRGRITRADVEALVGKAASGEPPQRQRQSSSEAEQTGSDREETLVFIHGFASDRTVWTKLARRLGGIRTVSLELPGHGREPPQAIASFEALTRAMGQALDGLGLDRMHLVGHSLGGALALALADARPGTVARLTLMAPAGLGPDIDGPTLAGLTRASRAESLAPWLKRLVFAPEAISWNYVRSVMAQREDPAVREAQAALAEILFPDGTQAFDLVATLARIEAPTRIIWGRADKIIPWQHALRAPGHIALHLFDQVGHLPHVEATDQVAAILSQHAALPTHG